MTWLKDNLIVIYPKQTDENQYLDRMFDIFRSIGCDTFKYDFKSIIGLRKKYDKKYIYLNWLENKTRRFPVLGLMYVVLFCLAHRFLGYKIIWVRHNKRSHDISGYLSLKCNALAFKAIEFFSSKIVSHGEKSSVESGDFYIPHPMYDFDLIPDVSAKKNDSYLIFGRMNSYKNIIEIIKSIPDVKLKLCGKFDPVYKTHCEAVVNELKANVCLDDRYVPDNDLNNEIMCSRGVILSNNGDSSIVSGVVYHCLTLGVPVYTTSKVIVDEVGSKLIGVNFLDNWRELTSIDNDFDSDSIINSIITNNGDEEVKKYIIKLIR